MRKLLGKFLLVAGILASGAAAVGCPWFLVDEPEFNSDFAD